MLLLQVKKIGKNSLARSYLDSPSMATQLQKRLQENLAVFDFALTDEEMSAIAELNCYRRFNDPALFCEAAFNTFHPIYD